ncbi:hypothetical protein ABPG72_022764 [Tetrahymena utriculariae]
MNLRNKRKVSSSTSEDKDQYFNSNLTQAKENTNSNATTQANIDQTALNSTSLEKEGSPKKNGLATISSTFVSTTDSILTNGSSVSKKLKTNSGASFQAQTSANAPCLKSAEQIIQYQQNVNNDCDIDCDGFREIFPEDLHTQLQEAIYKEQTIVLREAAGPKGFNVNPTNLFSFESVIKHHSDMQIDCRVQNPTVYGFNVQNPKNQQHVYNTTIQEYGEYATLLQEERYEEIKKKPYYKEYFSKLSSGVMFAVNIDMDDFNWQTENMRLRSGLPHYLLNKGKHDILSYHRQNVMGCTQPQMYLKVAGVWTGGHQENISVRAVNINHGDGDSDWYCVDFDQVEKYRNYVKKKYQVDIHGDEGLWFGKYNDPDVIKAGIRIKKVIQRKNDIVILAPGVLHWVRCRGKSVQTAWNFAYRRSEDIIAMNERFQYNQKINFETIILNKSLFMDLLNFEYHNLPLEVAQKLHSIVTDYYQKECQFEQNLTHYPFKAKNQVIFYDQLPAQLKHIQIYYCSQIGCGKEIFCYFGILRSEFQYQEPNNNLFLSQDFCGKYFCPICIQEMKKIDDSVILFRKFDLNSLKTLLNRVYNYVQEEGKQQSLYPVSDLTNISHFCGQITNINDFVFNKDVRRLEQVYIPDVFASQGVEEMQKFQLDLQSGRLIDFVEKPILKFIAPNQQQRCEYIMHDEEEQTKENQQVKIEDIGKKEDDTQASNSQSVKSANKNKNQQQQEQQIVQQQINLESKEIQKNGQIEQQQLSLNFESLEKNELSQSKNSHQHEDEKLAIQLQQQFDYMGSKTRKQKNNSQLLISHDYEISSLPQSSRVLRGGRSLCSKPPSQNQRKKSQQNKITSLKSISESNNSSKESSKQNQNEAQSPTSSSTTIGVSTNVTSPSLQQNIKTKIEHTNEQPQDSQMILEEQSSTPKQQINDESSQQFSQKLNYKIVSNSSSNSCKKSSPNIQNSTQNKNIDETKKIKIKGYISDDDDNDQEEIEKQKIRKEREEQRLKMMEKLQKEQESESKQSTKETKQQKNPSSEYEDDQSVYKKRLNLKQITNNSN